MKILPTPIQAVSLIEVMPSQDHRGSFYRAFCDQELEPIFQGRTIRQINVSCTESVGAIRGMHFQNPPYAEMKLVRCLKGRVWDVALDLRQGSPTFLQWHGVELSVDNARMLVIPEGCSHGFQVLEPRSELLYLHTQSYEPTAEGGVRYDDCAVQIHWPLPPTDVSERDRTHPLLTSGFKGIAL